MITNGPHKQGGFSLIELMVVGAIVALLASIAIPNFLRYQAKARQAESQTFLGGIFVAEVAFFASNGRYSNFTEIGYTLAGSPHRYTYRTHGTDATGADTGVLAFNATIGSIEPENAIVSSASGLTGFTATATANIDGDPTPDEWHVNDLKLGLGTPDTNDVAN